MLHYVSAYLMRSTLASPLWTEHFFTQGEIFWRYAGLFFWPQGMCADHLVPFSGAWQDPAAVWRTAACLLTLMGTGIGLFFPKTRLLCGIGILALIPLALRLIYFNKEFMVEYRAYAALPWACLLVGALVSRLWARHPRLTFGSVAAVVLACCWLSNERSKVWGDRTAIAQDAISQYPLNIRMRTHLQKFAHEEGNWPEVIRLSDEIRNALNTMLAYNQQAPQGRRYELSMAMKNYGAALSLHVLALVELASSQEALAYAQSAIDHLASINPAYVDPKKKSYEVGSQLVTYRDLLLRGGTYYDRLRANPQDEEARRQIDFINQENKLKKASR